jgi:hypothetical protein
MLNTPIELKEKRGIGKNRGITNPTPATNFKKERAQII